MADNNEIFKYLDKLETKFDRMGGRLDSMDHTLIRNTASLEEHVRRTELAENSINDIRQDLKPIKKHVAVMEGMLKAFGILATAVSIAIGIFKIAEFMFR